MKNLLILLILCSFIVLSGCKSTDISPEPVSTLTPEPGKSIMFGKLLSHDNTPYDGMTVRLAKVYRGENDSGAFVLDEANSPSAITDPNGVYHFLDIDPGEYVLFLGALDDRYKVISDPDDDPVIYSVSADEVLNIETIIVDFE
jgi:hypothetical protein